MDILDYSSLTSSRFFSHVVRCKKIREVKIFVIEDPFAKFAKFEPTKLNGTTVFHSIHMCSELPLYHVTTAELVSCDQNDKTLEASYLCVLF